MDTLADSSVIDGLMLQKNMQYFVAIRAVDMAGNKSDSVKTDGIHITSGNLSVYASGSDSAIRMGTVANATTVATTNYGFYADNAGNLLLKGDDSDTNYLVFNTDGGNATISI